MGRRFCGKSKRGVSLAEEVCAAAVLVIVVVAVIGAMGLARTSVLGSNTRDGAAAAAQEISDALIASLSGQASPPDLSGLEASKNAFDMGGGEDAFSYSAGKARQFVCIPVDADSDGAADGYRILTRVYYNGGKNYVQMAAYSSASGGSYSPPGA
jgi:hypothetical protein